MRKKMAIIIVCTVMLPIIVCSCREKTDYLEDVTRTTADAITETTAVPEEKEYRGIGEVGL